MGADLYLRALGNNSYDEKIAQLRKVKHEYGLGQFNPLAIAFFLLFVASSLCYLLGGSAPKAQRSSTLPEVAASKADLFLSSYSDRYPQESLGLFLSPRTDQYSLFIVGIAVSLLAPERLAAKVYRGESKYN